jgi:hypothetical protein
MLALYRIIKSHFIIFIFWWGKTLHGFKSRNSLYIGLNAQYLLAAYVCVKSLFCLYLFILPSSHDGIGTRKASCNNAKEYISISLNFEIKIKWGKERREKLKKKDENHLCSMHLNIFISSFYTIVRRRLQ